jgi:hypothetical protein
MKSGTILKALTLVNSSSGHFDLSIIPTTILAKALNMVEFLALERVQLSKYQFKEICDYSKHGVSKLKNLFFDNSDFRSVEMEILHPTSIESV